jgi:hypothetical protein
MSLSRRSPKMDRRCLLITRLGKVSLTYEGFSGTSELQSRDGELVMFRSREHLLNRQRDFPLKSLNLRLGASSAGPHL